MVLITDGQRMLWSQKVGNAFPSDVDVFLLVLWFSITHTQTHTHKDIQYTLWASRLTHPYKYIFTSPAMCSQQLPLLHYMIKWIIHWYQKFTFHNVFSFQKLFTCKSCIYICWLDAIRLGSFSETQIMLTEMV